MLGRKLCQMFQRGNSGTFYAWVQKHSHAEIVGERDLPKGHEYTVNENGRRYVVLTDSLGNMVGVTG